jgi:hypothetical protein
VRLNCRAISKLGRRGARMTQAFPKQPWEGRLLSYSMPVIFALAPWWMQAWRRALSVGFRLTPWLIARLGLRRLVALGSRRPQSFWSALIGQ